MPNRVISYRAIVDNVKIDGHPLQAVSFNMKDIMDWARKNRDAYNELVRVYVTREFQLTLVKPKVKKKVCQVYLPEIRCRVCGDLDCKKGHKQSREIDV